jgi:hypothetical protein
MKTLVTIVGAFVTLVLLKVNDVQVPNRIVRSQPTELEKFLSHMADRESDNTVHIVNRFGMMGKYQFDPSTIKMLGFRVTKKEFLTNSELQDSVMVANMRLNNQELNSIIKRYDGKVVKGIKITRSGILAAAHLAGPQNVMNFFQNTDWKGRTDANGTSIREYMTTFSGYKLINL